MTVEPFDNSDDNLKFVERLIGNELFMPFRITESKSIEKYNESLKCDELLLDYQIFDFIILHVFR